MSFLARHRTICSVIEDIKELASARGDVVTLKLCDEAKEYAESMSAKLVQYKKEREHE